VAPRSAVGQQEIDFDVKLPQRPVHCGRLHHLLARPASAVATVSACIPRKVPAQPGNLLGLRSRHSPHTLQLLHEGSVLVARYVRACAG